MAVLLVIGFYAFPIPLDYDIGYFYYGYEMGAYLTLFSGVVASLGGLNAIELGNEVLWLCKLLELIVIT